MPPSAVVITVNVVGEVLTTVIVGRIRFCDGPMFPKDDPAAKPPKKAITAMRIVPMGIPRLGLWGSALAGTCPTLLPQSEQNATPELSCAPQVSQYGSFFTQSNRHT